MNLTIYGGTPTATLRRQLDKRTVEIYRFRVDGLSGRYRPSHAAAWSTHADTEKPLTGATLSLTDVTAAYRGHLVHRPRTVPGPVLRELYEELGAEAVTW